MSSHVATSKTASNSSLGSSTSLVSKKGASDMEGVLVASNIGQDNSVVSAGAGQPTSLASSLASSSGQPPMSSCSMDCGGRFVVSEMHKSNDKARPMCKYCYNAKRALQTCAKASEATRLAWEDMQARDPELFRQKVLLCRIAPDGQGGPGQPRSWMERRQLVHNVVSQVRQLVSVEETGGLQWLARPQFISWHQQWDGGHP